MAVLSILMLVVSQVIAETQSAWRQTSAKVSQFREARRSFDVLKKNLTQATLNTYVQYKYDNPEDPYSPFSASGAEMKNAAPVSYVRKSELQFTCGPFSSLFEGGSAPAIVTSGHGVFFQAPLGLSETYVNMPTAMNGRGYFVQFGGDNSYRPTFLLSRVPEKFRYRLMEYAPPTEDNVIYDDKSSRQQSDWFQDVITWSRPVADNVAALYFSPRMPSTDDNGQDPRGIAPSYSYNSAVENPSGRNPESQQNQLPPLLDIVMVVLDEATAGVVADQRGSAVPFELPQFDQSATGDGFKQQLSALESYLTNYPVKLNFRIYTATVAMKNSKWGL